MLIKKGSEQMQKTIQTGKNNIVILNTKNMLSKTKIYSIKVSGIKCTNCAGKITKALNELLQNEEAKISVNIMQETVTITHKGQNDLIPSILSKLQAIGYPAIKQPLLLQGGSAKQRQLTIKVIQNNQTQKIEAIIKDQLMGLITVNRVHEGEYMKFRLSYDSEIIKGRQIGDFFQQYDKDYIVINDRVQSFRTSPKIEGHTNSLLKTLLLCSFFLIFNMFLPFTGEWYDQMITIPKQLKILSFAVIVNLATSGYVFNLYTRQIVLRAYKNYKQYRSMDMQTLVALGCLSAFALCGLFFVKYGLQIYDGTLAMAHMAVMDINDALTSASIIVLVVNVGKYLEHKVKRKIQAMTEEIFPESTLFAHMKVQTVELQNRLLKIKQRKQYDSTILQKGDIIAMKSLHNQRLLLDVILISGKVRAQQSTTSGCDQIMEFKKGDRIQSGSLIYPPLQQNSSGQCLAMVENVFEKSMLVEIGTQIKFSQNQQETKAEGIQAVCKSIANVFVKSVIFLSLFTMAVWAVLIKFKVVEMENMCAICWIVERGIGVLVASCPCALGLAVPSVIAIILNLATKSGILIKNNGVFEKMKITKKISFDKTGTLFTRINKIEQYHILSEDMQESYIWQMVALLQKQIRHPLAEVLYKQAFERCRIQGTNFNFVLTSPKVQTEKQGIWAQVRNKKTQQISRVLIGNQGILTKNNLPIPAYQQRSNAATQLFLAVGQSVMLVMRLNTHSNLRPQAVDVIRKIMSQGQQVHILSGDSKQSVLNLGQLLQIPKQLLHSEHSSFMKMDWIKKVQQFNKDGVMMIGDGLNDIPCLQQAAIGVSINAKSELNINAADVVVLDDNLYKILALIRMLKKGNLFININLFWAFSYNIVIMPIVAGVFYKWDFWVSPIWSSIAMSLSSIIVVSISHLLSFFNYDESLRQENKDNRVKKLSNEDSQLSSSANGVIRAEKKSTPYIQLIES